MTTTTSTFTPSTQILEAGEQAQALSDAGKALKPFLPQEAQQTIQGVEKVANALNATGQALKHFGFDEAHEEETIGGDWIREKAEGAMQVAKPFAPKEVKGPLGAVDKLNKAVDFFTFDPTNPNPTARKFAEAIENGDKKEIARFQMNQFNTAGNIIHEKAVGTVNDPDASAGEKTGAVVVDVINQVFPVLQVAKGIESAVSGLGKIFGWWDEMEPEVAEGPAFKGEFSFDSEPLAPIDFSSSVVTAENAPSKARPGRGASIRLSSAACCMAQL